MKRWSRRLAFFVAALLVLLCFAVLIERFRGEWALSSRLKGLAAKGEALSVAQLKPARPAPDQNVFTVLLTITNQMEAVASNLDSAPPSLRLSSPGRAVAVINLEEWSPDGKTTNDWKSLGTWLDEVRPVLSTVASATGKPSYDGGFDYEKGFVDFQLQPIFVVRRSAQLLGASVFKALKDRNLQTAYQDLAALLALTARQTPEPIIICQLVRHACAATTFNSTWQALQIDGWTDAQLASLQAGWQSCDFVKDMASAMEMERALTLDYYAQIKASKLKLNFVIQQHQKTQDLSNGAFGALPTKGFVLTWLHLPVWRAAWLAQDELASLEEWNFMIERERIARTNGWATLAATGEDPKLSWRLSYESKEKLGWYDRLRFLFASENFSISDVLIRRTLELQTEQQMALTVLGLRRYELRTGKLPEQLSVLVPQYLASIPHDFMNGKSLHYRLQRGHRDFLLYSAGEDGKDDGGDPTQQKEKKSYRQIWDGQDAVWPIAATSAESKAAVLTAKH